MTYSPAATVAVRERVHTPLPDRLNQWIMEGGRQQYDRTSSLAALIVSNERNARPLPSSFRQVQTGAEKIESLSIVIDGRSSGRLSLGRQVSKSHPEPRHRLEISATSTDQVSWEKVLLGTSERYSVVYEIQKFNDSPAFARIELDHNVT